MKNTTSLFLIIVFVTLFTEVSQSQVQIDVDFERWKSQIGNPYTSEMAGVDFPDILRIFSGNVTSLAVDPVDPGNTVIRTKVAPEKPGECGKAGGVAKTGFDIESWFPEKKEFTELYISINMYLDDKFSMDCGGGKLPNALISNAWDKHINRYAYCGTGSEMNPSCHDSLLRSGTNFSRHGISSYHNVVGSRKGPDSGAGAGFGASASLDTDPLPRNRWIKLTMYWSLGTPGENDGEFIWWLDSPIDHNVYTKKLTYMMRRWDWQKINQVKYRFMWGGNNGPTGSDAIIYFDNLRVFTDPSDDI